MQIWSTSGALCAGGVRRCNALRGRARILGLTNFPPSSSVHFICLRTSIILSRWFLRPLIVKILQLPIVYPLTAHFHAQSTSITPLRYAAALELSADALSLAPSPRCPPNSHTTCEIPPLRDAFPMAGERVRVSSVSVPSVTAPAYRANSMSDTPPPWRLSLVVRPVPTHSR